MAASDILGRAQAGRHVVQDFCPFADSLEWGIGQAYLRGRGSSAFISDSVRVPFAVNNDGVFAAQAAEVLFEQCRAWKGNLPEQIVVLDVGIGLGLFARFFLDHFRVLCRREKADFYQRVHYVLGDYSDRMLLDAMRHGVMDGHLSKWHARVVDARDPASAFPDDGGLGPFHAVILNYLLDCLPASVLRSEEGQLKQLCVRTCLGRNARLIDYTERTPKELAELAKSREPRAREWAARSGSPTRTFPGESSRPATAWPVAKTRSDESAAREDQINVSADNFAHFYFIRERLLTLLASLVCDLGLRGRTTHDLGAGSLSTRPAPNCCRIGGYASMMVPCRSGPAFALLRVAQRSELANSM